MHTNSLFRQLPQAAGATVTIEFDGAPLTVPAGVSLAAALLASGVTRFRSTPVSGAARAPYCMMGVCFECLMEVDGQPGRQTCQLTVRDGMTVRQQQGARDLALESAVPA